MPNIHNSSSVDISTMPAHPKEKMKWFNENFGGASRMHIDFIRRSLPDGALSTKSNSVSFISLNEKEGIIKIQYGSFIIEFPINSPITSAIYEWSQDYVVQFDGRPVAIDIGIKSVGDTIVTTQGRKRGIMNKLLPSKSDIDNRVISSKHIFPKRIIQIKKK